MKKRIRMIFGVASIVSFVGFVVTGWVAFFCDKMGFHTIWKVEWIFLFCFLICATVFSVLMGSDSNPDQDQNAEDCPRA